MNSDKLMKVQRTVEKHFTSEKLQRKSDMLKTAIVHMATHAPPLSMQNTEIEMCEYDDYRKTLRALRELSLELEELQAAQDD
jgi:CHAT domain-containing protein